jgi:hypothetical protein
MYAIVLLRFMYILAHKMYRYMMCKFMFITQYTFLTRFLNCVHKARCCHILIPFKIVLPNVCDLSEHLFTCSLMLKKRKVSLSADIFHGVPLLVAFLKGGRAG